MSDLPVCKAALKLLEEKPINMHDALDFLDKNRSEKAPGFDGSIAEMIARFSFDFHYLNPILNKVGMEGKFSKDYRRVSEPLVLGETLKELKDFEAFTIVMYLAALSNHAVIKTLLEFEMEITTANIELISRQTGII